MTETRSTKVPQAAVLLGAAGLVPFAGLALAVWVAPVDGRMAEVLAGYGVVILSFMGGCRWGLAAAGMGQGPAMAPLGISVIPALYAWLVWATLSGAALLAALAVGLIGLLVADLALTRAGGAPAWWSRLRWPLSLGAAGALTAGAFGVLAG